MQFKGGLPTIAVRDMKIQEREGDLVLATFGRGFYVLDDISVLRQTKAESLQQSAALFPVKDSLMYIERHPLGGQRPHRGRQGSARVVPAGLDQRHRRTSIRRRGRDCPSPPPTR